MQNITAQQSRDARRELGLSQADVTKALGFNRQYISEFETGFSTRLTNTQLKKLRTFYEDKITETNASGEKITLTFGEAEAEKSSSTPTVADPANPEGVQRTLLAVRHLAIDQSLNNEQVINILKKVAANDLEAESLLNEKVERGVFSDWSERTDSYLKQVFGLFAANYVLMRHLQGRPLVMLEKPAAYDEVDTVAALFSPLFHEENGELVSRNHIQDESLEVDQVQS